MSEPRYRDDDDEIDKTVDVTVPDDAGRIVEIETPYQQSRPRVAMERQNEPTDCPVLQFRDFCWLNLERALRNTQ
jgi:hypothetical protein